MSYDYYLDLCHERYYGGQEPCDCMEINCEACCGKDGWLKPIFHCRKVSEHVARKDHFSESGQVLLVKKGQRYTYTYDRQVVQNKDDGEIIPSVAICKVPVSRTLQERIDRHQRLFDNNGIFKDELNKYKQQLKELQSKGEA